VFAVQNDLGYVCTIVLLGFAVQNDLGYVCTICMYYSSARDYSTRGPEDICMYCSSIRD
jgi:hypothetical protein